MPRRSDATECSIQVLLVNAAGTWKCRPLTVEQLYSNHDFRTLVYSRQMLGLWLHCILICYCYVIINLLLQIYVCMYV